MEAIRDQFPARMFLSSEFRPAQVSIQICRLFAARSFLDEACGERKDESGNCVASEKCFDFLGKASGSDSDSRSGTDWRSETQSRSENSLSLVTALRSGNACSSKNALISRIASGRPPHAGCPRGNLGLFRQTCFPLLIYYAIASEIPLANGAYRQGPAFWKRSLFVSLISLLLILPSPASFLSRHYSWSSFKVPSPEVSSLSRHVSSSSREVPAGTWIIDRIS